MSIRAIVSAYIKKYRDRTLDELNWFREQSSIRSAIEIAALAKDRRGKRLSHQRRLSRSTLEQAHKTLDSNIEAIETVKDFDELFNLIEAILEPITGIGELYVYDTSLRIGAKLGKMPEKVYLHAGTRAGAKALGIPRQEKSIEPNRLPAEFQELEPHEIEDVLCIFKRILEKEKIKV